MKRTLLLLTMLCAAFSSYAIKITYGPYIQRITENSFTVVWTTDKSAVSWVEIAPNDKTHYYAEERPKYFQNYLGRKKIGKLHCVTIPNLEKGTIYRYRVYSQEVTSNKSGRTMYGRVASTRIFGYRPLYARTFDSEKKSVRCMIMNDIHNPASLKEILLSKFSITPKGRNINGTERKRDTQNRKTKFSYDMVFYNGGMVSEDEDRAGRIFSECLGISSQTFADELPIFMVRGTTESWGKLGLHYTEYFPTTTNNPYYIVRQGPVCFIVLDSALDKKDKVSGYDFEAYRAQQAVWLKEVLESPEVKSAAFRVALMHIPPIGGASPVSKELNKLFVPMLEAANLDLMICGYTNQSQLNKAGSAAKFPILENSSYNILTLNATAEKLDIEVNDIFGALVKTYNFEKR